MSAIFVKSVNFYQIAVSDLNQLIWKTFPLLEEVFDVADLFENKHPQDTEIEIEDLITASQTDWSMKEVEYIESWSNNAFGQQHKFAEEARQYCVKRYNKENMIGPIFLNKLCMLGLIPSGYYSITCPSRKKQ